MRLKHPAWMGLLWILSLTALIAFSACEQEKERSNSDGSDATPQDEGPAEIVGQSTDDEDDDGGGNGPSGSSGKPERFWAQCQEDDLAFVAAQDGKGPQTCGNKLVDWCCTKEVVYERFKGNKEATEKLDVWFEKVEDKEHKLYHCSTDENGHLRLHAAKVTATKKFYLWFALSFRQQDADDDSCRELEFCDLWENDSTCDESLASSNNGAGGDDDDDGGGDPDPSPDPSADPSPDPSPDPTDPPTTNLTWDADINPIMENSCGGDCHVAGNPRGVNVYVDNEANVLGNPNAIKAVIRNGQMPPAAAPQSLDPADRDKLIEYIDAKAE